MMYSYGETSGFAPVSDDELTTVNGGVDPLTVGAIIYGVCFLVGIACSIVDKQIAGKSS